MTPALEILQTGPLALLQDRGRVGLMAVGVGRSGAADRAAYELGGRLLGNAENLAAIEVTFGGLQVRARGEVLVCVTGAPAPAAIEGRQVGHAAPVYLRDGQVLSLSMPPTGLRSYLSVRGGFAVAPVLGSRSSDTMSGLGPAPLGAGDVLDVGTQVQAHPHVDLAPVVHPGAGPTCLRVTPGPRVDWFADPVALAATTGWLVSDRSDRKGVRLSGEALQRNEAHAKRELPSEGMVRGAIQVPPDGQPVVFLNDHPVTGGYPVIAVVRSADVDLVAQLRPGQQVRLQWDERPGGRS